jgi:hypothetical protein
VKNESVVLRRIVLVIRLTYFHAMLASMEFFNENLAMERIIQANIDRFQSLLETTIDPTKRAMIIRLLAEEKAKQKQLAKPELKKMEA